MIHAEGIETEFKSIYSDDIKKTAVAFANTNGGKIYVGVSDDGSVIGLTKPDVVSRQIVDSIRNSIKPDLTRFMRASIEVIDKKNIVVITIERGVHIPYYLAERGLKPSGVYIRLGSASIPATEEHIRQMVKSADGDSYISGRSLIQELTFVRVQKEFDDRRIPFGVAQMRTLGILNDNELYTNLGLLLSEQCQHTTKIAVFEGVTKAVFKSRMEFTGSLIKQLYDIIAYLDYFNLVRAEIGNVRRIESRDYPVGAIREAVLNALVHREYGLSASTFINVYDDRMEFLSIGGLARGITLPAVLSGVSLSRNEALANVLYRLELVEAYGTGILRIMDDYTGQHRQPKIDVTDSSFMMTLPNMRLDNQIHDNGDNEQEKAVFNLIERDGYATTGTLAKTIGLGITRCHGILKKMQSDGKITAERNGRRMEYRRKTS